MNRLFFTTIITVMIASCSSDDNHSAIHNDSIRYQNVIGFAHNQIMRMMQSVDSVNALGTDYLMPVSFADGKLVGGGNFRLAVGVLSWYSMANV